MEYVLVLVLGLSIATVPGIFSKEEECHVAGKKWAENYKGLTNRRDYACLPTNFMYLK